ncbi:19559_t:CDS:2, partial [Cetraspora pellucida]
MPYIALEILQGKSVANIYGFKTIVVEMTKGKSPFDDSDSKIDITFSVYRKIESDTDNQIKSNLEADKHSFKIAKRVSNAPSLFIKRKRKHIAGSSFRTSGFKNNKARAPEFETMEWLP